MIFCPKFDFWYAAKFIDYIRQMRYSSECCCNWLVLWLIAGCRVVYFVKRMEFNYVEKNNTCVMPRQHPDGASMTCPMPDVTIPDTFPPSQTVNLFSPGFLFFFFSGRLTIHIQWDSVSTRSMVTGFGIADVYHTPAYIHWSTRRDKTKFN